MSPLEGMPEGTRGNERGCLGRRLETSLQLADAFRWAGCTRWSAVT